MRFSNFVVIGLIAVGSINCAPTGSKPSPSSNTSVKDKAATIPSQQTNSESDSGDSNKDSSGNAVDTSTNTDRHVQVTYSLPAEPEKTGIEPAVPLFNSQVFERSILTSDNSTVRDSFCALVTNNNSSVLTFDYKELFGDDGLAAKTAQTTLTIHFSNIKFDQSKDKEDVTSTVVHDISYYDAVKANHVSVDFEPNCSLAIHRMKDMIRIQGSCTSMTVFK